MPKLYLVDGMSVVFRAYHAMSGSGLKTPEGEPSAATFGFINILTSMLEKEKPENLLVVFDTSTPTFRHEMYPLYKANRDAFPEELVPQLAHIKEFLDTASIPRSELPGFEADDVIGTLSRKASEQNWEVACLTADKDFYQLVGERVRLYKPSPKPGEVYVIVDIPGVYDKFGVEPRQVIDVLALIGDSSDNVPGVKGIGEKTAIPLIQKYGSLEDVYEHIDEIASKSVQTKLLANKEMAFLSKTLVTIDTHVDLPHELDHCVMVEPDYALLDKLLSKLGFNNLRRRWMERSRRAFMPQGLIKEEETQVQDEPVVVAEEDTIKTINDTKHDYNLINTKTALQDMLFELEKAHSLSVDLETSSLDKQACEIVGISIAAKEGRAFYIAVKEDETDLFDYNSKNDSNKQESMFDAPAPTKSVIPIAQEGESKKLPVHWVIEQLKKPFENHEIGKFGQNIKFDASILKRYGITLSPIIFDSMIASYLINPDSQHNLDALSLQYLNYKPVSINSLIGEKKATQISMRDLPPEMISDYACEDADLALRLKKILEKELEEKSLSLLAADIEFPLIEVLVMMENNGVAINTAELKELSIMIEREAGILSKKIFEEAGTEFNLDSPKQLGHVLFEKMQLPPVSKTKTGYSTDVQVMTELAQSFPIAGMILEYRQLTKLQSTYVTSLPKLINPRTGRVHTTYNQAVTSTGRLTSTDPNLQNIPIRTELGKRIRAAFVPQKPDNVILSADYSQIEIRIMAHYSGDAHLIEAFQSGKDIHTATASILFDIPLEQVDSDQRRTAKAVNFGIMYGLGSFGLEQQLSIQRNKAKEIIDNYFLKYPGIKRYMDDTIESVRDKGYAETLCGRKRHFPAINSQNRNERNSAERAAINMPIQGTASDMMKIAMIKIFHEMKRRKVHSLMLLQVHDELVFEVPESEIELMKELVKHEMETALTLGEVPVVAETGTGKNWYLAH